MLSAELTEESIMSTRIKALTLCVSLSLSAPAALADVITEWNANAPRHAGT